jgi:hypothetical protein
MVRLRNAVMAVALGTGAMGCAFSQPNLAHFSIWHCDECDDFPMPAQGSGDSMMPGTYTGPPARDRPESTQPTNSGGVGSVPPPQQPADPTPPATTTPPTPPAALPGQEAAPRPDAAGPAGVPGAVAPRTE